MCVNLYYQLINVESVKITLYIAKSKSGIYINPII